MKQIAIIATAIALTFTIQPATAGPINDSYADGDPLTVETMDNIKAAVNDNDARVGANATAIGTNATDIGANTTAIGANATDIGANATDIGTNAAAIGANAAAIGANATNIGDNVDAIGAHAAGIGANTTAIGANATDIGNNSSAITVLESKANSGIFSVSAIVGIPRNTSCITAQAQGTGYVGRAALSGCSSSEFLVAPVTLPDGATITAFRYTASDADATVDSSGILWRTDNAHQASASTTGSSGLQTVTTTSITDPVIDNSNYGYYVYMGISGTSGSSIVPVNVVVEYTLP